MIGEHYRKTKLSITLAASLLGMAACGNTQEIQADEPYLADGIIVDGPIDADGIEVAERILPNELIVYSSIVPEAIAEILRRDALNLRSCSAGIRRDESGNPEGFVTAAHCPPSSTIYAEGNRTENMATSTATWEIFTQQDIAFGTFSNSISVEQVKENFLKQREDINFRKLPLGLPVYTAGYPNYINNVRNEELQLLSLRLLGVGARQDGSRYLYAAGVRNENGAICSNRTSGMMGSIFINGELINIGPVSTLTEFVPISVMTPDPGLAQQGYDIYSQGEMLREEWRKTFGLEKLEAEFICSFSITPPVDGKTVQVSR